IQARKEVIEKYQKKPQPKGKKINPAYGALVESLDDSVGRLMKALEEMKLSGRTYVFFTSDNGGLVRHTSNKPLREGKGTAYEGGIRVPLIVRGQGIPAGAENHRPVITPDFFPTILSLAALQSDAGQEFEGVDLNGELNGSKMISARDLFWHYPHYHSAGATPHSSVRSGDFKLIQFYEDGRLELYNLKDDLGETQNLVSTMPQKVQELLVKLELWRKKTGAQSPLPNPNYDPEKDSPGKKG
ncbi:MAG: sulfatase-like hydrolase/transferase, partial [Limisphaerales bacterium]